VYVISVIHGWSTLMVLPTLLAVVQLIQMTVVWWELCIDLDAVIALLTVY